MYNWEILRGMRGAFADEFREQPLDIVLTFSGRYRSYEKGLERYD